MKIIIDEIMHSIEKNTCGDAVKFSWLNVKSWVFIKTNVSKISEKGIIIHFKIRMSQLKSPIIFNFTSLNRNI